MRAQIHQQILYLHHEDVPFYKKKGSIVRNSYFWALKSIADRAMFDKDWEFADEVWPALGRMLLSFAESGYLGYRETALEFQDDQIIPDTLKVVGTWIGPEEQGYPEDEEE